MRHDPRKRLLGSWSTVLGVVVALLVVGSAKSACAQQDTTAPVIVDFTASPVVFDTGPAEAVIHWCVSARDDLSGIERIVLFASCAIPGPGCDLQAGFIFPSLEPPTLTVNACSTLTIPRFSRYGTWQFSIWMYDSAGTLSTYYETSQVTPGVADLCSFGPCTALNRAAETGTDSDNDGTPDDADNCPNLANPDQADSDVDLIGDACDPFPDERDNEQAQCEADLGQSSRDAKKVARTLERVRANLAAERADADGDGVRHQTDECPGTPSGADVDGAGCSLPQFCGRIDATTEKGRKTCKRADWKNDEPLMKLPAERDCTVDLGASGVSPASRCATVVP